jgi:phage shock protein E
MKKWIFNNKLILAGAMLGGFAGYLYYHFIGCSSGTCMISSKPVNSTVYFAVMGAVFFSLFKKEAGNERNKKR